MMGSNTVVWHKYIAGIVVTGAIAVVLSILVWIAQRPEGTTAVNGVHAKELPLRYEPKFGLGAIKHGQKVSHTFVIRNVSRTTVKLLGAKVSCGVCTTVSECSPRVEPDGVGRLTVQFDPKTKVGPGNQTVLVMTDCAEQPSLLFTLSMFVYGYDYEPKVLDFGVLTPGEVKQSRLVVRVYGPGNAEVKAVHGDNGDTSVALDGALTASSAKGVVINEDTAYETKDLAMMVSLDPAKCQPGDIAKSFRAELTSLASGQRCTDQIAVPVTAYNPGGVRVIPAKVFFGTVIPGESRTQRCRVHLPPPYDGDSFRGISFSSDSSSMRVSVVERTGNQAEIELKFAPEVLEAPTVRGRIVLTDSNRQTIAAIPWMAIRGEVTH